MSNKEYPKNEKTQPIDDKVHPMWATSLGTLLMGMASRLIMKIWLDYMKNSIFGDINYVSHIPKISSLSYSSQKIMNFYCKHAYVLGKAFKPLQALSLSLYNFMPTNVVQALMIGSVSIHVPKFGMLFTLHQNSTSKH
jgi:hypothetical protein